LGKEKNGSQYRPRRKELDFRSQSPHTLLEMCDRVSSYESEEGNPNVCPQPSVIRKKEGKRGGTALSSGLSGKKRSHASKSEKGSQKEKRRPKQLKNSRDNGPP